MAKHFKVTQVRSTIACTASQIRTMEALGLRGRHKSILINDHPANRGQIMKVQHLVEVEVLNGAAPVKAKPASPKKKAPAEVVASAKSSRSAAPQKATAKPATKEARS